MKQVAPIIKPIALVAISILITTATSITNTGYKEPKKQSNQETTTTTIIEKVIVKEKIKDTSESNESTTESIDSKTDTATSETTNTSSEQPSSETTSSSSENTLESNTIITNDSNEPEPTNPPTKEPIKNNGTETSVENQHTPDSNDEIIEHSVEDAQNNVVGGVNNNDFGNN